MLLTITGPLCSGKYTLASRVLNAIANSIELKMVTDSKPYHSSFYQHVSASEFDAMDDMLITCNTEYRFGISRKTLTEATLNVDCLYVMVCAHTDVVALSKLMPKLNTPSLCVYLHCRINELLKRLADRQQHLSPTDLHNYMQNIYADHNAIYTLLENTSIARSGFTAVIPMNSGFTSCEDYKELVVDPLIAILDSFRIYKNMRKFHTKRHSLGVVKYAD